MYIKSRLEINGIRLAYCVGDDIPSIFNCKKINIANKVYDVLKAGSSKAFCGKMNALLQLDIQDGEEIPLGEFFVIE